MTQLALGIDIGGTKVAGGAVGPDGSVVARARRDTPHRSMSPDVVENTIVAVVDELVEQVAEDGLGEVIALRRRGRVSVRSCSRHLVWLSRPRLL